MRGRFTRHLSWEELRRLADLIGQPRNLAPPLRMTRRVLLRLSTCLALAALPAAAQDTTAAQREIREALESWRRAFNAGDASRVCDLFAPDLISNYQGQPERNFESLCALLRHSLEDPERSFRYALDVKEILISGDLAVVRLVWTLQIARKAGGDKHSSEEPGMDVFRLQHDGRWRIIRYIAYPAMR